MSVFFESRIKHSFGTCSNDRLQVLFIGLILYNSWSAGVTWWCHSWQTPALVPRVLPNLNVWTLYPSLDYQHFLWFSQQTWMVYNLIQSGNCWLWFPSLLVFVLCELSYLFIFIILTSSSTYGNYPLVSFWHFFFLTSIILVKQPSSPLLFSSDSTTHLLSDDFPNQSSPPPSFFWHNCWLLSVCQ